MVIRSRWSVGLILTVTVTALNSADVVVAAEGPDVQVAPQRANLPSRNWMCGERSLNSMR